MHLNLHAPIPVGEGSCVFVQIIFLAQTPSAASIGLADRAAATSTSLGLNPEAFTRAQATAMPATYTAAVLIVKISAGVSSGAVIAPTENTSLGSHQSQWVMRFAGSAAA